MFCKQCGVEFHPATHKTLWKYCTPECREEYNHAKFRGFFDHAPVTCGCGKEFIPKRRNHYSCSKRCCYKRTVKKKGPPMSHQGKQDMKMQIAFEALPQVFKNVVDSVIAHKLTLSSDLLTTRRVLALAIRRHPIKITNVERSSLHQYINERLEAMGGVLEEDFKNSVNRPAKEFDYPASAIYRMKVRA